jgi:hypothetical protein
MQPFGVGADCVWEIGGNQFARYFCTGAAIFSANLHKLFMQTVGVRAYCNHA